MTRSATKAIPFVDLDAQRVRLGGRIDDAIGRVLEHGQFIMGPEVGELEQQLAAHCGARHAVSCASGTDALLLALMAHGIGPGDAVLVPAFTFPATPEVAALLGATPVFIDVLPDTANLDADGVTAGLDAARAAGLRPRALIAVDLYGQPADYDRLEPLCRDHELLLIDDAAQSFGATWQGRPLGTIADITCTSFFPSKPLGCYGDGGAVLVDDDATAATLRSLRAHGRGDDKYDIARVGINGRLDTIQAAVLLEKLAIFDDELDARRTVAGRYDDGLAGVITIPVTRPEATTTWAQYTVQTPARDRVAAFLGEHGIPTAVHYPRPLHLQAPYSSMPRAAAELPVAERLAQEVLSLPMHPYLDASTQDRVVTTVREAVDNL